jgi:hypothetical protein
VHTSLVLRFLLVATVIGAVGAAVATGTGTRTTGGLYGQVVISPAFPVCVAGRPCTAPARQLTLLFRRRTRLVARATTDGRGRYRVALPAGSYRVAPARSVGVGRGLDPRSVSVPRNRYARVNFTLDVGIR